MNTVAIVILYNPVFTTLLKLYQSVVYQVKSLVFVDNSQLRETQVANREWIEQLEDLRCYYLPMSDNLGIATAQNKGIEFAKTLDAQFVLLLDQDSALPDNMIVELLSSYEKLKNNHKVAVVAPSFIDEKTNHVLPLNKYHGIFRKKVIPSQGDKFIEVSHLISSGSLISIEVFDKVGLMQDSLFIDYVDTEWCLRCVNMGYQLFVIPAIMMTHNMGDGYVNIGNRQVVLHSDFRNYFTLRNMVYLILYGNVLLGFKITELIKLPFYLFLYTLLSKNKLKSFKIMLIGIKDGLFKKMGKGYFENKGL